MSPSVLRKRLSCGGEGKANLAAREIPGHREQGTLGENSVEARRKGPGPSPPSPLHPRGTPEGPGHELTGGVHVKGLLGVLRGGASVRVRELEQLGVLLVGTVVKGRRELGVKGKW